MSEFIETPITETNGQVAQKIYVYSVNLPSKDSMHVAIIAPNSTMARSGIAQKFNSASIRYECVCEEIIQVN